MIYYILSLITSAGALILLIRVAGFENLSNVIKRISVPLLLFSMAVYGTSWFFRTMRLSMFVNRNGTFVRARTLFKINISGFALNNFSPAKLGDAATIGFLRMYGIQGGRAAAIVVQTRVLDLLSIVLMALCGMMLSLGNSFPSWVTKTIFICVIIIPMPYIVVWSQKIHNLPGRLKGFSDRARRAPIRYLFEKAADIYQAYSDIAYDRSLFLISLFYSVLIWVIEGISCFVIARAVGADLSMAISISAVALANIGKGVPVTPGGIGVYEGVMVAVLSLQGLQIETSLAIALCDHLTKKVFTVLIGIPATFNIVGFSLSRIKENLKTPLAVKNEQYE